MPDTKFQRTKEDFECAHCGLLVHGNGYTNHCPDCLRSKHVDINPGDRESSCCGLMHPIDIETKGGEYILLHKCTLCGIEKRNRTNENDNLENFWDTLKDRV